MVTGEDDTLSQSERLELLSSKRRRTLLEVLANSTATTHSLESLATAITQTEQPSALGARPARRVCLSLHHVHLPKLDDAGLVTYDAARNVVEHTDDELAERLLDRVGN